MAATLLYLDDHRMQVGERGTPCNLLPFTRFFFLGFGRFNCSTKGIHCELGFVCSAGFSSLPKWGPLQLVSSCFVRKGCIWEIATSRMGLVCDRFQAQDDLLPILSPFPISAWRVTKHL